VNFFKRDRTFREPIGKLTTFFMVAFHIGAIAALFMFTWKAFFVAMFLWWVAGRLSAWCQIGTELLDFTF